MTYIIAEVGVNHQGSPAYATEMIDVAKECGADAVKFQLYDPVLLEPDIDRCITLEQLALSREYHFDLKAHCRVVGIEYICTPFDVGSLRFLVDDLKVKTLKISSGDIDNTHLLIAAAESGCVVILSTGMANYERVYDAVLIMDKHMEETKRLTLMHCTSAYPTPDEDVNLQAIKTLDGFGYSVGFSDHSLSVVWPVIAVSMGAVVIEKHITLDRNWVGPDHCASLMPMEFAFMVDIVRQREVAMGDGKLGPRESEKEVIDISQARRKHRLKPDT